MTLTVLGAMLVTPALGWLVETQYDPRAAAAAELEQVEERVREELLGQGWTPLAHGPTEAAARRLLDGRGVEALVASRAFSLPLANGRLEGDVPNPSHTAAALSLVETELSRYSRPFLKRSRLLRVVFAERLVLDAVKVPSLPNYERTLILDPDAPRDFLRRLVHHELFHFLDYADDDEVGRDPDWERLNEPYFVYGSGGRYMRDADAGRLRHDLPGFLTRYATAALEEDKAEIFAFAMTEPVLVRKAAERDPVIARKLQAVQGQLSRFDPDAKLLLFPAL